MSKDVEIEIQVQLQSVNGLLKFLKSDAIFIKSEYQVDEYFTPKHRDFTKVRPIMEWLRLRKSGKKYSINYKKWHYEKDGRSHFCDEYESEIVDLIQLKRIFKALNLKKLVKVEKNRNIWMYKDYEIAIDEIKGLGNFVEIEYKGKFVSKSPAKITSEMVKFLQKFNPGKISKNYVGYPFQLMFPNEVEIEVV